MPSFCGVFGCSNRADRDEKSFYRLPAALNRGGSQIVEASKRRRQLWINALKRADLTEAKIKYLRICQDHFVNGAPAAMYDVNNPDWIPTVNMGYTRALSDDTTVQRFQRSKRRRKDNSTMMDENHEELPDSSQKPHEAESDQSFRSLEPELERSIEVQTDLTMSDIDQMMAFNHDYLTKIDDLESSLSKLTISERMFENDDARTLYYTGIPTFQALMVIVNVAAPFLSETHKSALSKFQQVILTLMRLRLGLSFTDLGYRFSVSRSTVSRIYPDCLYVLYQRLKKLIKWPGREQLRRSMPQSFLPHFGNRVAVIIDCFEVFIERPSNLCASAESWSNYKHHNTIKFLIGIAPQGVITFISEAWGGRVSDKFLTEQSGLLENLLPGDVVLADTGFTIADSVGLYCAEVKIPAFTKGKKQLSAQEIEATRNIAHVRIHVERVIGTVRRKFKILKSTIPISMLVNRTADRPATIDQIVTVCCALTNLCPSVIPMDSE